MASDYLEHLQRAAEAALASLRQHGIPPTATNYSVWLAHHAGHSPALSRALRAIESAGEPLDEARHLELAERFLGRGAQIERIEELVRGADNALEAMAREVGGFRREATAYGATLEGAASSLAVAERADELRRLVIALRSGTEEMRSRAEALEQELQRRDAELGALRTRLAQAEQAIASDPLTGIGNRRLFDKTLARLVRAAAEQGEPLSLLMVDIDHFKRFNDTHGHTVGDLVLKLVAAKLAEKAQAPALAARYGGEEFAIILPGLNLQATAGVAEAIRSEVAAREVVMKTEGRSLGTVTLSIGAATLRPGESVEELVARADAALYRAKGGGRNRVEIAG